MSSLTRSPTAPRSVEDFHDRLQAVSGELPKRLRQCAEYLAANTDRIAVSTVAEIAAAADVQPSAVMRFCQIMGFPGFSAMQKLFRDTYAQGWPDYATRITNLRHSGPGTPAALLAEFADVGVRSLQSLTATVDPEALERAVAVLAAGQVIHAIGLRRAFPVACYLAYAFEKMEIPVVLHERTGSLDRRNAIRPGDALVAISFAPYSEETVNLAEHCRRNGIPVVAITDTVLSPLWQIDGLPLAVREVDFGAFRSLSATLSLAITLAVAVGARRG